MQIVHKQALQPEMHPTGHMSSGACASLTRSAHHSRWQQNTQQNTPNHYTPFVACVFGAPMLMRSAIITKPHTQRLALGFDREHAAPMRYACVPPSELNRVAAT